MRSDNADSDRRAARASAPMVWERTGGLTGLIQSSLPATVLVITNSWRAPVPAVATTVGTGVLVALLRAVCRQPLRPAFGGFVGVAISGFLAARNGEARDFFLADIGGYVVASTVLVVSILLRRPLVGLAWSAMQGAGMW